MLGRRLVVLSFGLVLALAATAWSARATPHLDGLETPIQALLEERFDGNPKGRERRCKKAFEKALELLQKDTESRADDLKILCKIIQRLGPWLPDEEDIAAAIDLAMDELRDDLDADRTRLGQAADRIEDAKTSKKTAKSLVRYDKHAAKAAAATKRKTRARRLFAGAKQIDKGLKLAGDVLDVGAAEVASVRFGLRRDENGVQQVVSLTTFRDGSTPRVEFVTSETKDVESVVTPVNPESDNPIALYVIDGNVIRLEIADGAILTWNATADLADAVTGRVYPSPDGRHVVVHTNGASYVCEILEATCTPLASGSGRVEWSPDSKSFVVESTVQTPAFGKRLDLFTEGQAGFTGSPVAGPDVDGVSAYAALFNADGSLLAFRSRPTSVGIVGCSVYEPSTGRSLELVDSCTPIRSGDDFSDPDTRDVPCVWVGTTTALVDTTQPLVEFQLDLEGVDLVKVGRDIDPTGSGYALLDAGPTVFIVLDGFERELFAYDSTTGDLTPVGSATDATEQHAKLTPDGDAVVYARSGGTSPSELRVRVFGSGQDVSLHVPNTQVPPAATTLIRNLRVDPVSESESALLTFNVSGTEALSSGIYGMVLRVEPVTSSGVPVRLLEQQREWEFRDLLVELNSGELVVRSPLTVIGQRTSFQDAAQVLESRVLQVGESGIVLGEYALVFGAGVTF